MSLDQPTRDRIDTLIRQNDVMLFMKGNRGAPQCGFSATVVGLLDRLIADYETCDVLSDPSIREGIKAFSSWPTIPQLYVGGEFLGGCDIIQDLFASGELHEKLGVSAPATAAPSITVSEKALAELRSLAEQRPGQTLHLTVDARLQSGLYFGPEEPGDLSVALEGLTLAVDPLSASRADGVTIDVVETDRGVGFAIDNPNAPKAVNQLTVRELKELIDRGDPFVFLDVRTPEERETARIPGARLLDEAVAAEIDALPRDTKLVFHCHHGGRSQAAAEHFSARGFGNVHNVVGGIDAWSVEIDPSVPRY